MKAGNFKSLNILLQKLFQKDFILFWKIHEKMANFPSHLCYFLSIWKWRIYKVKCQKVEFHCKALYQNQLKSVKNANWTKFWVKGLGKWPISIFQCWDPWFAAHLFCFGSHASQNGPIFNILTDSGRSGPQSLETIKKIENWTTLNKVMASRKWCKNFF